MGDLSSAGPQQHVSTEQEELAVDALADPAAASFLEAVLKAVRTNGAGLTSQLGEEMASQARRVVRLFSQTPCEADAVDKLFSVVYGALEDVKTSTRDDARRATERAATALYFLAAGRLINLANHPGDPDTPGMPELFVPIPESPRNERERPGYERIVSAVIANALFGGKLEFEPSGDLDVPVPRFVFRVQMSPGHHQPAVNFERAAYTACIHGAEEESLASQRDGPLDDGERSDLRAFLRNRRKREKHTVALVLRGAAQSDSLRKIAKDCFQGAVVPIVVPDTAATSDLLGMKLSDLEAEIRDFWITLHSRQGSDTSRASQRKLQGGSGMTSKDSGTHFHAPVHFDGPTTFGAQSPAVSGGNVNVAYLQKQGVDLEKLNEVFNTLLSEIANIRSDDDRDRLNDDAERLKDKLGKEKVGDPNALKGLFDRMERAAKPLENGTKIITALTSIYKLVAVPLGLPPLP